VLTVVTKRVSPQNPPESRRPAATTPEGREQQLVALAVDEAERQMRAGVASAQVVTHYLKLGSSRERLEQERIAHENELLVAKREALASQARVEELYGKALAAMQTYSGQRPPEDYPDD
jgi:putative cell wall-binding protein